MKTCVLNTRPGDFDLSEKALASFLKKKKKQIFVKRGLVENTYYHKPSSERKSDEDGLWHPREIERTDPDLIETVKQFGKEVNTIFSHLEIVELEDKPYEIICNDGKEEIRYK